MLARLAWILLLLPGPTAPWRQAPATEPLAPAALRVKLRLATSDIAKCGDEGLVERMKALLLELGDSPQELARSGHDWDRLLLRPRPQRATRTAAGSRLRRELEPLVAGLATEAEPRRTALARCLVALDSDQPAANAVLGRERAPDGLWRTAEERVWQRGAERAADLSNLAGNLAIEIERGTSANPALLAVAGGGSVVRAHGLEVHGRIPVDALERVLRQALRAAALSRGLLSGDLDLPRNLPRRAYVLLDEAELLDAALEEALTRRGLQESEQRQIRALDLRSFHDARGWCTARWRSEADFAALILWDLVGEGLGPDAQPCLRMGHLNWVCLRFLGTSAPLVAWSEASGAGADAGQRSSARAEDPRRRQALWRCARQSLWGTRAWMLGELRAGRDPPWARAMLDQDGKIRDANLLKTTLACELLQQEGRLVEVLEGTRAGGEPTALFEKALGEPLARLEERFRLWLDPPRHLGIVQELLGPPPAGEGPGPFSAALLALNQARADALAGQGPEIPLVVLDPELAHAAAAHARYLTLNPDQKTSWPAVHEEFAGAPGFTPEGALAAARALVAFDGDAEGAVMSWLGTFYHRLPLLEPGLFGVGFGQSEEVVVLDAGSLVLEPWKDHVVVWPLPEAEKVPLRFTPEIPNPVPTADMGAFGYPVSVQLTFQEPTRRVQLLFELFRGAPEAGALVECHLVSPDAPHQRELVPPDAWGLIPKAPLAPLVRYTARARWDGQEKLWSFTTGK